MSKTAREAIEDGLDNFPDLKGIYQTVSDILTALDDADLVIAPKLPTQEMQIDGLRALVMEIERQDPRPPKDMTEHQGFMKIGAILRTGREVVAAYRAMIAVAGAKAMIAIQDRLRQAADFHQGIPNYVPDLMREAASEIDRLEALYQQWSSVRHCDFGETVIERASRQISRETCPSGTKAMSETDKADSALDQEPKP